MPTWEFNEMVKLATCFPKIVKTQAELQQLYDMYDGIPRNCFVVKHRPSLDTIMKETSADMLMSSLTSFIDSKLEQLSHQLFKMVPLAPDYSKYHILFLSKYVEENFAQLLVAQQRAVVLRLVVDNLRGIPETQALRGYLFERFAHEILAAGNEFDSNNNNGKYTAIQLPICAQPSVATFEFFVQHRLATNLCDRYVKFARKNFALIDALYWPSNSNLLIGYQMTVSSEHSFSMEKADKILQRAGELTNGETESFHIYYVVPPDVYDTFACPQGSFDGRICCFKLKMIIS
jgi:hypothetical protein